MEIDGNMNLGPVSGPPPAARSVPAPGSTFESDSFVGSSDLAGALQNVPEVRADVVAQARAAVNTDGYPPPDVLKKLSSFLAGKLQSSMD
jgi:hypothetical protein